MQQNYSVVPDLTLTFLTLDYILFQQTFLFNIDVLSSLAYLVKSEKKVFKHVYIP